MEKKDKLDRVFMRMAKEVSTLSYCTRSKVGAVIVREGNVISFGYNGMPSGMDNDCEKKEYMEEAIHSFLIALDPEKVKSVYSYEDESKGRYLYVTKKETLHAESNAILKAAKHGFSTNGSTLYLTTSPCVECSKLIIQSGIKRLVYLTEYRDISGLTFLKDFVEVEQLSDEV
jgi:dCMP deaminase